jgi:hypothetical protein
MVASQDVILKAWGWKDVRAFYYDNYRSVINRPF